MLVFIMEGKREFAERGAANAQTLSPDLFAAVEAVSRQAPQDLMRRREQIISAIEDCCKCLRKVSSFEAACCVHASACLRISLLGVMRMGQLRLGSLAATLLYEGFRAQSMVPHWQLWLKQCLTRTWEQLTSSGFGLLADCCMGLLASPSGLVLLCWVRCQLHAMGLALSRRQCSLSLSSSATWQLQMRIWSRACVRTSSLQCCWKKF